MDRYNDNYPLGYTEKFEVIDYKLKDLQKQIDSGVTWITAQYLEINQNPSTGEVLISLLNGDREVLDTKPLTITGKLVASATLSLQAKTLSLHCLDGSTVDADISSLIDDYTAKATELGEAIEAEAQRAQTAEAGKVDKVEGKGLSENDFTDALKAKLDGIEEGAQDNVIEGISVDGRQAGIEGKTAEITAGMLASALFVITDVVIEDGQE